MNAPCVSCKLFPRQHDSIYCRLCDPRFIDPPATKNLLARREVVQRERRFTGEPLTGFGELPR